MDFSDTPKLSLIISCYNQGDYLEKILYSLLNQSFKQFELVIADDGSNAKFIQVIEQFKSKFHIPIQHIWHEDDGFRKTIIVNRAVQKSKSDYLVFIDGDCILHHHFLARHYKRREKGVVLSGRRIMFDQTISESLSLEKIKTTVFEKPSFWWNNSEPKERKRGFYIPFIYHILNGVSKDYWTFGSNFSLHKSDFIAINGYDENIIGRGLEDINLSQRFKLKGYKTKRLTYEALQYHLFHNSKPVSHSEEAIETMVHPKEFYAKRGIDKYLNTNK